MKKVIISILLVAILLFSGCSCSEKPIITIENELSATTISRQYNVKLDTNYNDSTSSFKYEGADKFGNIAINGTYVININKVLKDEVLNDSNAKVSKAFVESLSNSNSNGGAFFKQTTILTLNVNYEKGKQEGKDAPYTSTDTITSTSYFYGKNFTPIYNKTQSNTSYVAISSEGLNVAPVKTIDEIIYDLDKYTIIRQKDETSQSQEYEYKANTLLDNSALLLAIEQTNLKEVDKSKSFAVVSYNYGNEKDVRITCNEVSSSLTINNKKYENIKRESFCVLGESNSCLGQDTGKAQIVYLQNNTIIKYVCPLTSNDLSFTSLGALVYELAE